MRRDIFAAGGGLAPKMTPLAAAVPPIITPPANSPMPLRPQQPASAAQCVGAAPAVAAARVAADGESPGQTTNQPVDEGAVQDIYPSGLSEK